MSALFVVQLGLTWDVNPPLCVMMSSLSSLETTRVCIVPTADRFGKKVCGLS